MRSRSETQTRAKTPRMKADWRGVTIGTWACANGIWANSGRLRPTARLAKARLTNQDKCLRQRLARTVFTRDTFPPQLAQPLQVTPAADKFNSPKVAATHFLAQGQLAD